MVDLNNPIEIRLNLEESVATARMLNTIISGCEECPENERTLQILKGVVERIRNAVIDDLDRNLAPPGEEVYQN